MAAPPDPTWTAGRTGRPTSAFSRSVRGMGDGWTFAVTLVRPGPAVPFFEVGAYQYTGTSLPHVGDIVTITKTTTNAEEREEMLAYVTRVDPRSDAPIRVTEATSGTSSSPDDLVVGACHSPSSLCDLAPAFVEYPDTEDADRQDHDADGEVRSPADVREASQEGAHENRNDGGKDDR